VSEFNPSKLDSSNYYTLPHRPNLPFLISDIQPLWRSALSSRMPECQKLKMVRWVFMALNIQNVTTNHMTTLDSKGLKLVLD